MNAQPRTDSQGRPIVDRVVSALTWGRVAFLIIVGFAGFGTFVAGEVSGARELDPRVRVLEEQHRAMAIRADAQAETLAEIKGYARAIAARLGAEVIK